MANITDSRLPGAIWLANDSHAGENRSGVSATTYRAESYMTRPLSPISMSSRAANAIGVLRENSLYTGVALRCAYLRESRILIMS